MSPSGVRVTTDVARAAAVLRRGGLVAFPTETVYGLGADAADPAAVAEIYRVKGRPGDHPVIVHVASPGDIDRWAREVPGYARRLAARFWPGPLTLVLPRAAEVGDHVTGGLDSVGLRCPSHPVARDLLTRCGTGVAAPSANRFGRVSPTTAAHVVAELGDCLDPERDLVLDGGPCQVGVESTIVDCTGAAPAVLRPGAITAQDVRVAVAGPTGRAGAGSPDGDGTDEVGSADRGRPAPRVPGSLPSHYAPLARVEVVEEPEAVALVSALRRGRRAGLIGLVAPASVETPAGVYRLAAPDDPDGYARSLYGALRRADEYGLEVVVAVPPPDEGIGHAVRDRLRRAAHSG